MSIISDLVDRHTHYCNGDVCEIAMNGTIFEGIDKVVEETENAFKEFCNNKRQPEVRSLIKIYNDNYATLIRAVIQCCADRPPEFRDVDFIAYLSSKYTYFKKLRDTITTQTAINRRKIETQEQQKGG